jgi:hypothetical protein
MAFKLKAQSLRWNFNRLRSMSFSELVWRLKQFVQSGLERNGFGLANNVAKPQGLSGPAWLPDLPTGFDSAPYRSAADRILSGRFDIFAMLNAKLNFPPHWNQDPKTGQQAPLDFGLTLNYRNKQIVGNIKYLWEINRHLELVTLAQAWHLSGEAKYIEGARTLLNSWLDQCPYARGPNWTSSLEHAVRIANWSFAWHLLKGDSSLLFKDEKGQVFKQRWLQSIYKHCHFIHRHFSRHSSANNHLLGEYMGLFLGAVTWPFWKECAYWLEESKQGLEEETRKQIAPDGVNREQAIWYQHEVADMMLLCGLVGKASGIEFSHEYWRRLELMLGFIASVMDAAGNVPMIGDSDDAMMVRFSPLKDFHVYRSLLATGAVLFNRSSFKVKAGHFDDKSRWLLGDAAVESFNALSADSTDLPVHHAFSHGGYYILGENFEAPNEVRIVVDSGPLGYLSIAAHGHADALSVCLSAGGKEFLIDPGTYAYHTETEWRNYFRGTSAHNTVRIDDQDQSVIGGNFLWLAKASAICERWQKDSKGDLFCGSHDGYCRLADPVHHQRCVRFLKNKNRAEITDSLECKGEHRVERFWHFSERCRVQEEGNGLVAENDGWRLRLEILDSGEITVVRSDVNRPLGWVSRRFDTKHPTTTAFFTNFIKGTTILHTILTLEPDERKSS